MPRTVKSQRPDWSRDDLEAVLDNPEWTAEDFALAKPASEVLAPEFLKNLKRRRGQRGPQKGATKQLVSLRLDRDIIDAFRESGPGWQSRINDALRKALAER